MGIFSDFSFFNNQNDLDRRKAMDEFTNNPYQGSVIEYELKNVEFNSVNRKTTIYINQKTHYKTIVKYFRSNYERIPFYSDWKLKEKMIIKKIILNNFELENLEKNEDELIRKFSSRIIEFINKTTDSEFYPSWYKKKIIELEFHEKMSNEKEKYNSDISNLLNQKNQLNIAIRNINELLENYTILLDLKRKKQAKIERNIARKKLSKFFLSIFSFSIFSIFNNKKRLNKIISEINWIFEFIEKNKNDLIQKNKIENEIQEKINKLVVEKKSHIDYWRSYYQQKISSTKSLLESYETDEEGFIYLKDYYGNNLLNKIKVGCYIIKNNDNGKCYVGQSKNIPKRIRDHFDGIVPKNFIFFEDYYKNKDNKNLFSIKVQEGNVLELDILEIKLIDKYNSYELGYNKTAGNSTTLKRLKEKLITSKI